MSWTRLIRFVAEDGSLHYGEPQIDYAEDLQALLIAGNLFARELVGQEPFSALPTDTLLKVRKILGPLAPENVPVFRCVGINYHSHST